MGEAKGKMLCTRVDEASGKTDSANGTLTASHCQLSIAIIALDLALLLIGDSKSGRPGGMVSLSTVTVMTVT